MSSTRCQVPVRSTADASDRPATPIGGAATKLPQATAPAARRPVFQRYQCVSAFDETKGCVLGKGPASAYLVSKGRKFDATQMDVPSEDAAALSAVGRNEIFCLADGHGGFECSRFMVSDLVRRIEAFAERDSITEERLGEAFSAADGSWAEAECCDSSGTTATVAVVSAGKLTVAHVGDSSALIVTVDGDGVRHGQFITKAHVACDSAEAAAVEARGGCIEVSACKEEPARVNGELEVTRALGDLSLKPAVSSSPDVFSSDVTEDMLMLIIASDGLWDQVSINEVLRETERSDPAAITQQLAKLAYAKNGRPDDISVYTRFLQPSPSSGPDADATVTPLASPPSEAPSSAPPVPPTPPLLSPRAEIPVIAPAAPPGGGPAEPAASSAHGLADGAFVECGPGVPELAKDAPAATADRSRRDAAAVEDSAEGDCESGDELADVLSVSVHLPVAHPPSTPRAAHAHASFLDTPSAEAHDGFECAETVVDLHSAMDNFSVYQQTGGGGAMPAEADRVALAMWDELQDKAAERVQRRSRIGMLGSVAKWAFCVTGVVVGGVLIAHGVRNR